MELAMKLPAYASMVVALCCLSMSAVAASEKSEICYPKNDNKPKLCQPILFDLEALPFSLISKGEVEAELSSITKYGSEITKLIHIPAVKKIADRIVESANAAGFGPMLAIARLALNSRLNG